MASEGLFHQPWVLLRTETAATSSQQVERRLQRRFIRLRGVTLRGRTTAAALASDGPSF